MGSGYGDVCQGMGEVYAAGKTNGCHDAFVEG